MVIHILFTLVFGWWLVCGQDSPLADWVDNEILLVFTRIIMCILTVSLAAWAVAFTFFIN